MFVRVKRSGQYEYLQVVHSGFEIDEAKVAWEARFDGKWVLRTDTELSPADCALRYKDLWMVEQSSRSFKSVLETRPIYHRCDETIRGHVSCSFLALMLLKELLGRIERRGWEVEWERLCDDLDALDEITIHTAGRSLVVRSAIEAAAGRAIQAAGVALGSAVRLFDEGPPSSPAGKSARSAKDIPVDATASPSIGYGNAVSKMGISQDGGTPRAAAERKKRPFAGGAGSCKGQRGEGNPSTSGSHYVMATRQSQPPASNNSGSSDSRMRRASPGILKA